MQLCAARRQVTAVDISARRIARVTDNLARSGLTANVVTADAAKWAPSEKFDAILIDAPCSGTGTLRRHPDIAWLKGEEDIARLNACAGSPAAACARHAAARRHAGLRGLLAAGGRGRGAHQRPCLGREPTVKRLPVQPAELPGLADAITPRGDIRTLPSMWPERGGLDGFYIARLQARP